MASNTYTQDIIFDADGKPVLNALAAVEEQFRRLEKMVAGIGVQSRTDAQKWGMALAENLKLLKQAKSDLTTLQQFRDQRGNQTNASYQQAEKQAKAIAQIEVNADKEALNERKINAKVYYGEKQRMAKEEVAIEKQLEREIRDFEIAQDKRAVASAKEVANARREAATAAVTAKARGITNPDDARAAKAASDARLNFLRREREAVAGNDADAARGIAARIQIEKQLQSALNQTIALLDRQAEAQHRAQSRFTGSATKLLAPSDVAGTASRIGATGALGMYQAEQAAAQAALRATVASRVATDEQRVAALKNLEIANQRVTAAERLVNAERRATLEEERQNAAGNKKTPLQNILSPDYAKTAFARTALYGVAAGAAYGAFNAVQGGLSQVIQMEDELAKLQAIANATAPQMQVIKAAIYGIGEASRFSVVDLAKISQTLAQAGVTAGDMEAVLKSVTTLATASGSTPDEAVNLVTSALGSFQLQASEASRVADLMTAALNRTKLTVQQTGQAIQYVGATAFEQNISLEQLLATIGAVAQAGIKSGSTIGTGFRQFLVDLANPSEKLTTQLSALKLTAADVDVTTRGLPAVLDTLRKAGFGAGQAYAGLETRAAAFYLVAKNNVDIMDQLQLSFSLGGAAAVANERAMNSLTAQWQRFKNILAEGLDEDMQGTFEVLKNLLKSISDTLTESESYFERKAREGSTKNGNGIADDFGLDPLIGNAATKGANALGNFFFGKDLASGGTIGARFNAQTGIGTDIATWFSSWTTSADGATAATERLATAVAETTEEAEKQKGKISELDKETARLALQKDDLRDNDIRSGAEMATLTSKFQGLALYLTNTGNRYDDLTQAVTRYRLEQMKLLNLDLTAQQSALNQQTAEARVRGGQAIRSLQNDPAAMAKLSSQERMALKTLMNPKATAQQFQGATAVLSNGVSRFSDNNPNNGAFDRQMVDKLNGIVQAAGVTAINTTQANIIGEAVKNNTAANTREGNKIRTDSVAIENIIKTLGSASGSEKAKVGQQGLTAVTALEKYVASLIPGKSGANLQFLKNSQTEIKSLRNQIEAALEPTKKEAQAAAKEARAAAAKEKLITQADLDAVGRANGLRLGSGPRTPAEQEALFRRGVTKARGIGPNVSDHVGKVARDFPTDGMSDAEAERVATTMRAQYRAKGLSVFVKYENGKGKNNGTGPHIHTGVQKGAKRRVDNSATESDRYDNELGQAQIALDEEDLKIKLKAVASATTKETFDQSVNAAKAALDKVNGQLKDQALDELAFNGVGPNDPKFKAKMLQVDQTIAQNVENFQQKIADAILASVKGQIAAADLAFEKANMGAKRNLSFAQAQANGLDAYSLRNKVPDYVKALAQNRIGKAQEEVARSEYNSLPARINSTREAIANGEAKLGTLTDPTEVGKVNDALKVLNQQLADMVTNRETLGAQLGADGLLPTNFSDGLNKAIEAYREAHNMNETFSQSLTNSLGGALDEVNSGLTQMFTSIMDGSQSALSAFGTFAKGIMKYMVQLAAKAVATQVFNLLLSVVGGAAGGSHGGDVTGGGSAVHWGSDVGTAVQGPMSFAFNGGGVDSDGYIRRAGGGIVDNGTPAADSVKAKLARGEWVVRKRAVDSVGSQFMARLNNHGAQALEGLQAMPKLDMQTHLESNIYVVPPQQKPSLGPNDVRVIMTEDLMNGDSKRLVEHISRSSR